MKNIPATVDNPACCVWRELLEAYPDAEVLLTLHPRGPEAWYESTIVTIYFTENMWQFKVLELCTPFGRKMGNMSSKLIWKRSHRGTMKDKAAAIKHYLEHVEEIKAAVPADRLLIFKVNEGWEPLCKFLDVAIPKSDFPNVNDRAEVKKNYITKGAYVFLTIGIVALAGIIYGLIRFFV